MPSFFFYLFASVSCQDLDAKEGQRNICSHSYQPCCALIMFANHFNNEFLAGLKYDLGFAFGIKL